MFVGNFNYKHQHHVEGIINKYQKQKIKKNFPPAFASQKSFSILRGKLFRAGNKRNFRLFSHGIYRKIKSRDWGESIGCGSSTPPNPKRREMKCAGKVSLNYFRFIQTWNNTTMKFLHCFHPVGEKKHRRWVGIEAKILIKKFNLKAIPSGLELESRRDRLDWMA